MSLTVFPDTVLGREVQAGLFREAGELERLDELRTLLEGWKSPLQSMRIRSPTPCRCLGGCPKIVRGFCANWIWRRQCRMSGI